VYWLGPGDQIRWRSVAGNPLSLDQVV